MVSNWLYHACIFQCLCVLLMCLTCLLWFIWLYIPYALVPLGFFLASAMHSRWKLTSIRRCSGGITECSPMLLNSWYSWGSIAKPLPDVQNFQCLHWNFPEPFAMFCLEKCSANTRRCFADTSSNNRRTFAEHSPIFLIWDAPANLQRSICEASAINRW